MWIGALLCGFLAATGFVLYRFGRRDSAAPTPKPAGPAPVTEERAPSPAEVLSVDRPRVDVRQIATEILPAAVETPRPDVPAPERVPPAPPPHPPGPPEERGGGGRGRRGGESGGPREESVLDRPEFVCWKAGREWQLGVELPEALSHGSPEVTQGTGRLPADDTHEDCWRLGDLHAEVVIISGDDRFALRLRQPGDTPYLVFKCRRDGRWGRRVRSVSRGIYLTVAPAGWQPDVGSASPLAGPEPTSIPDHHGYLFDFDETQPIVLRTPEGLIQVAQRHRIDFVGHHIPDGAEGVGPLFGQQPPRLRAPTVEFWNEVRTVVVGQEGRGRGRWRAALQPVPDNIEQDLSEILAPWPSGWFFVRLYDGQGELLDSFDFRCVRPLKALDVVDLTLPGSGGHRSARVEFVYHGACLIAPDGGLPPDGTITNQPGLTVAMLPANPFVDETRWSVRAGPGWPVSVTILLERLWWGIGDERSEPDTWTDKPFELPVIDFSATSMKALWFRVHRPRRVVELLVGFDRLSARRYEIRRNRGTCTIPLRNFTDAQELRNPGQPALKVWLPGSSLEPSIVVNVFVRFLCTRCQAGCDPAEPALRAHLLKHHVDDLFRVLSYEETYQEVRGELPSLPKAIYKCPYCPAYVAVEPHLYPTSVIGHHIERECHDAPRGRGLPRVQFRVISDVAEVRRHVNAHVPTIYECMLCGERLKNAAPEDRAAHLFTRHHRALFEIG